MIQIYHMDQIWHSYILKITFVAFVKFMVVP